MITVAAESVPLVSTPPGRAVAQDAVCIRPRVDGVVTGILYEPGRPITAGTPMFRIDPATYEAAVEEAGANLASAQAAVPQSAAYDRPQRLQGSASTQSFLEQAQAAEAALRTAQLRLSWTTITSLLGGAFGLASRPVAQYPDIAPATLRISATYTGASPRHRRDLGDHDHRRYHDWLISMTSTSAQGASFLRLAFDDSVDADISQVQVQNKLQLMAPQLPNALQT